MHAAMQHTCDMHAAMQHATMSIAFFDARLCSRVAAMTRLRASLQLLAPSFGAQLGTLASLGRLTTPTVDVRTSVVFLQSQ